MRIFKKIILLITGIAGATLGLILLAIINLIFQMGWSFSTVCLYGLTGGLIVGWIAGWLGFIFIINWLRKKAAQGISRIFTFRQVKFQKRY